MFWMRTTGPGLGINGLEPYDPHQPLNPFKIHFAAQPAQMISHRAAPPTRGLKILLIDKAHQFQILRFDRLLLVVEGRSGDVQQPALTCNAQSAM